MRSSTIFRWCVLFIDTLETVNPLSSGHFFNLGILVVSHNEWAFNGGYQVEESFMVDGVVIVEALIQPASLMRCMVDL